MIIKTKTYYLASTGNDKNKGTISSPWKTVKKINKVHLLPGDKVFFKSGDSFKGTLMLDSTSNGLVNMLVLISTYGQGKALINGANATAVQIKNATFITIQNLKLLGAGRKNGNTGNGILIVNSSNILVDDLDISGFQDAGVSVYASAFIKLIRLQAHDNGFAGIAVSGAYQQKQSCNNIYIGYCNAINNPGSPVVLNNHSGNGIIAGNCSKVVIEYCTAANNGWDMPRIGNGPVGIWCYEADSVIIQHCISYRNKTSVGGGDGGGFDLDGGVTNSVIQYCLSYQNQGSGFGIFQYAGASGWRNNTIRFNISENDGEVSEAGAGIYIWNGSDDSLQFENCTFYNNTIYNYKSAAIGFAKKSERKGFLFYNNIFVAEGSLLKGKRDSDTFLGNNWWSLKNKFDVEDFTELKDWANKTGEEMIDGKLVGLNIDPGFKNTSEINIDSCDELTLFSRYKVSVNSLLQSRGLDLKTLFELEKGGVDFNGKPLSVNSIGACFADE